MKKILVADDDESIRYLFKEFLQIKGFEVKEAENGFEALMVLSEEDFNLMILDIKMPGKHGLEVLEKIRERHKELPVVVCTAYKNLKEDVEIIGGEHTYFLAKPIDLEQLEQFIYNAV